MISILSWTTKKHQKTLSRPLHSTLKKIQGLFKDLYRNLRTFQGKMEFKDFSRTSPKIQGLFKTMRTQEVNPVITLRRDGILNSLFVFFFAIASITNDVQKKCSSKRIF